MSQEIVEAVRALAREKGISEEKLITALEDALLSAYKKQPGAVRYARVHLDPDAWIVLAVGDAGATEDALAELGLGPVQRLDVDGRPLAAERDSHG